MSNDPFKSFLSAVVQGEGLDPEQKDQIQFESEKENQLRVSRLNAYILMYEDIIARATATVKTGYAKLSHGQDQGIEVLNIFYSLILPGSNKKMNIVIQLPEDLHPKKHEYFDGFNCHVSYRDHFAWPGGLFQFRDQFGFDTDMAVSSTDGKIDPPEVMMLKRLERLFRCAPIDPMVQFEYGRMFHFVTQPLQRLLSSGNRIVHTYQEHALGEAEETGGIFSIRLYNAMQQYLRIQFEIANI